MGSATLTHFLDDFLGAGHEFKVGFEMEETHGDKEQHRKEGNPWRVYWRDFNAGNPYYNSTARREGRFSMWAGPAERNVRIRSNRIRRYSSFIQDSISFSRLTLNVGFRYDHSYFYFPDQTRGDFIDTYTVAPDMQNPDLGTTDIIEALAAEIRATTGNPSLFDEFTLTYRKGVIRDTLSPRIGLVYDLFGDGKTAVKLSFSRYYEALWLDKYDMGNVNEGGGYTWTWWDDNENMLQDLPGVDTYRISRYPEMDPDIPFFTEEFRVPYTNEFIVAVEHELVQNFQVSLQFIGKVQKNIVEDMEIINGYDPSATDALGLIWLPYTFTDPGWDQEVGTGDDQQLTVYGLRDDRPSSEFLFTNPPEAKRTYYALILGFDKRMSNNWMLKGSILYSEQKANALADYYGSSGGNVIFDNPNAMINAYGRSPFDHPWQVRIMASYILPMDTVISVYAQHRSGSPWRRTFDRIYFPDSMDVVQSYVSIAAEPRGARRNASYTMIDLRLEKGFKFGTFGDLRVFVDVFNLGGRSGINISENIDMVYNGDQTPVTWEPGPSYGNINSVYGVRTIHLGVRFSFF